MRTAINAVADQDKCTSRIERIDLTRIAKLDIAPEISNKMCVVWVINCSGKLGGRGFSHVFVIFPSAFAVSYQIICR